MNSKPQQPLTESEIETLKKMQDFIAHTFDMAAKYAQSRFLGDAESLKEVYRTAATTAEAYVRVTELLSKNRNSNGPS